VLQLVAGFGRAYEGQNGIGALYETGGLLCILHGSQIAFRPLNDSQHLGWVTGEDGPLNFACHNR